VNSGKLKGFSAKARGHAGLTGIDPVWLDLIRWIKIQWLRAAQLNQRRRMDLDR
jgi:hypothetical protein